MKGLTEVVEVVIGMLIVFTIFQVLYKPEPTEDVRHIQMKIAVLDFLRVLDEQGKLTNLILNNNTSTILEDLQDAFPTTSFTASIDDNLPELPQKEIYSVAYFIPGNYTYFKPSKLTVYMWFS